MSAPSSASASPPSAASSSTTLLGNRLLYHIEHMKKTLDTIPTEISVPPSTAELRTRKQIATAWESFSTVVAEKMSDLMGIYDNSDLEDPYEYTHLDDATSSKSSSTRHFLPPLSPPAQSSRTSVTPQQPTGNEGNGRREITPTSTRSPTPLSAAEKKAIRSEEKEAKIEELVQKRCEDILGTLTDRQLRPFTLAEMKDVWRMSSKNRVSAENLSLVFNICGLDFIKKDTVVTGLPVGEEDDDKEHAKEADRVVNDSVELNGVSETDALIPMHKFLVQDNHHHRSVVQTMRRHVVDSIVAIRFGYVWTRMNRPLRSAYFHKLWTEYSEGEHHPMSKSAYQKFLSKCARNRVLVWELWESFGPVILLDPQWRVYDVSFSTRAKVDRKSGTLQAVKDKLAMSRLYFSDSGPIETVRMRINHSALPLSVLSCDALPSEDHTGLIHLQQYERPLRNEAVSSVIRALLPSSVWEQVKSLEEQCPWNGLDQEEEMTYEELRILMQ